MDKLQELLDKQTGLIEESEELKTKGQRLGGELDIVNNQIAELKKTRDADAYKFVLTHMPDILEKIAPKHKIPPDRDVSLAVSGDSNVKAKVPWTDDKDCSDANPFNVSVCPRCALLHFKSILDRNLADYFA